MCVFYFQNNYKMHTAHFPSVEQIGGSTATVARKKGTVLLQILNNGAFNCKKMLEPIAACYNEKKSPHCTVASNNNPASCKSKP